jgi:hypothetical protein
VKNSAIEKCGVPMQTAASVPSRRVHSGPGAAQVLEADRDHLLRLAIAEGHSAGGSLWRDADDVEQGDGAGGRTRRTEGLELVLICAGNAVDDRNACPSAPLADEVAEDGKEGIPRQHVVGKPADVDQHVAEPSLVGVQTSERGATEHRGRDVDEVAVTLCAGPEHAVGEDDRVGLSPCDVRALPRPVGQQIRRAGPGRVATEFGIQPHQRSGAVGEFVGAAPVLRVLKVYRTDVERCRHAHAGPAFNEGSHEVDRHWADVETAVHVGAVDVDEFRSAHRRRDGEDHPRRHGHSCAELAVQATLVALAEADGRGLEGHAASIRLWPSEVSFEGHSGQGICWIATAGDVEDHR